MSTAVFTMVHNEDVFLPYWLSYYSQYDFDLHVVDHDSTDGSIEAAQEHFDFTLRHIHHPSVFDPGHQRAVAQVMTEDLLEAYDVAIFSDADEFVVADPLNWPGGLGEYIEKGPQDDVLRCNEPCGPSATR